MNRSSHHFDRPTRSVSRFAAPTALRVALVLLSGCAEDAAPISERGAPDASMEADVGSVVDEISGDDPVGGPVIYYESGEDTISSASYVVDGDELIVEGDISLGTREEAWAVHVELATEVRESRLGNKNLMDTRPRRLWNRGVIHYDFDDHFKCRSASDTSRGCERRKMIDDAIDVWNELTPLTGLRWDYKSLRLRDSGVRFYYNGADGGCSSSVGSHPLRRRLKLGADCFYPGIIQHEMGHSMGLFHEHQRDDRDEHVWFDRGALDSDYWQYRQHSRRPRKYREIGSYDPNSLMHYGTLSFASGELPVMTNMEVWDMYNPVGGMGSIPTMTESREWNFAARLDGRGFGFYPVVSSWGDTTIVEESTFRVLDVDANGFDDIVASSDEGVMWSVRGASGWIPLSVDGGRTQVDADIHAMAIGNLDSSTGLVPRIGSAFRVIRGN